jgi:hypothetical protein
LGLNFGRLQIAIAFEELLAQATNFRIEQGAEVPRLMGVPYNSPSSLPLACDKR